MGGGCHRCSLYDGSSKSSGGEQAYIHTDSDVLKRICFQKNNDNITSTAVLCLTAGIPVMCAVITVTLC